MGRIAAVSYRKGRRLEHRVRDIFRRRGWVVVRAAGSKPVDLVCLKRGEAVLVECKYGVTAARWSEVAPLLDIAYTAGARPVLAVAGKRGEVRMIDVEAGSDFKP